MSDGPRTSRRDLFRVLAGRRPAPAAEVPTEARQVAGTFVHLYYVRQDPLAARALAGGAARARLEAESALVAQAGKEMNAQLDREVARVRALQRVNPGVRPEEIAALVRQQAALDEHLRAARLRLDAIRLIRRGPE